MKRATSLCRHLSTLFALAAAASAQTPASCNVRIVNEYLSATSISLTTLTGTSANAFIANVPLYGVSSYVALPDCSGTLQLRIIDENGGAVAPVSTDAFTTLTTQYTFVVISTPWDTILVKQLNDRDSQVSDTYQSGPAMDIAVYKVFNALAESTSVDVHGVTTECDNCARPFLFNVLFATSTSEGVDDYIPLDTTWGQTFSIASSDGTVITSDALILTPLEEHGSYTLFIHNIPAGAGGNASAAYLTWAVDSEGQDAYIPVLYAFLILLALGILHKAARWLAIKVGITTDIGDKIALEVKQNAKKTAVDVNFMSFFGFDKAVARVVNKDRASGSGGKGTGAINNDSSHDNNNNNNGGNLSERLLAAVDPSFTTSPGSSSSSSSSSKAPRVDLESSVAASDATTTTSSSTKPRSAGRIRAIDTFRGFALCIMIFVNYGGGGYTRFFDHSRWNGLTVADLVFPWFVWTQGVSMAISFASERKKGATPMSLAKKTVIRSAKLYFIGMILNNGAVLDSWRVIGVLQYFAVSYLVVGLLEAFLSPLSNTASSGGGESGTSTPSQHQHHHEEVMPTTWREAFWLDIGRYWAQWSVMGVLGTIYMVVQSYLPVDGCPTGYLGAGGLADNGAYMGLNCTGGAHRAVDVALFGIQHIYHDTDSQGNIISAATCNETFQCDVHDPEGALGWISAAWMVWLGLQAGRVITTYRHVGTGPSGVKGTVKPFLHRWLVWGVVLSLLGGAMCGFTKNDGPLPINKNLWSPSFVFVLAGWGFLKLAFHYMCVDVWKLWTGAPFRYVGTNSIVVYATHELLSDYAPLQIHLGNDINTHQEALISNLLGVITMISFARYLYLRGIFINV